MLTRERTYAYKGHKKNITIYFPVVLHELNVVSEWLILLLHIQEGCGPNLNPETTVLAKGFCGFLKFAQINSRIVPSRKPCLLPSVFFPIHY